MEPAPVSIAFTNRLANLSAIERELINAVQAAGSTLQELSKDKTTQKQIENHSNSFLKSLENVERDLSENISYLTRMSTGHPHEGSAYASQKVVHMAEQRLAVAKDRLGELDAQVKRRAAPPPSSSSATTATTTSTTGPGAATGSGATS